MNYRKGLTRIAILWIVVWCLVGWSGYQMVSDGERGFHKARSTNDEVMIGYYSKKMALGDEYISEVLKYGLAMPVLLMTFAGLTLWVWRGFKSKSVRGQSTAKVSDD